VSALGIDLGGDRHTTSRAAGAYDAVIVGAGPAGSSAAIRLARRGWRVALVERSRFEAVRIGESLAPAVRGALQALGAWNEFLALAPLPSWGTRSIWGTEQPQSHSHITAAYGCGWHIDRRAFDETLAQSAARAGAQVLIGHRLRASQWRGDRWYLQLGTRDGATASLTARVLIDATGRSASVARALGARRLVFDRLVGVATSWAHPESDDRAHLLVETAADGWWYSARLPAGARRLDREVMFAMLMTDADLCALDRRHRRQGWHAALAATHATRARLRGARCIDEPLVHCAHSHRLQRSDRSQTEPRPWLAIGDAALAVDPLSGSGVLRALSSGRAGADTADQILQHPHTTREALAAYEAARDDDCTTHLLERARHYASERRFDTPFWQRRRIGPRSVMQGPEQLAPEIMAGAG
jgi:flavin-dependent dehydrogenase